MQKVIQHFQPLYALSLDKLAKASLDLAASVQICQKQMVVWKNNLEQWCLEMSD